MSWSFDLTDTVFDTKRMPQASDPEVAFLGRSNVGKSTLINALLNRTSKKIAHVSSTPGKTRSINFYRVRSSNTDIAFSLVDLPGYGHAARSRGEREQWMKLVDAYFASRDGLTIAAHLIDFRHGPLSADEELISWMDEIDIPRFVVFTKCDKVPKGRAKGLYVKYMGSGLISAIPPLMMSGKNDGEAERLRSAVEEIVLEIKKEQSSTDGGIS